MCIMNYFETSKYFKIGKNGGNHLSLCDSRRRAEGFADVSRRDTARIRANVIVRTDWSILRVADEEIFHYGDKNRNAQVQVVNAAGAKGKSDEGKNQWMVSTWCPRHCNEQAEGTLSVWSLTPW